MQSNLNILELKNIRIKNNNLIGSVQRGKMSLPVKNTAAKENLKENFSDLQSKLEDAFEGIAKIHENGIIIICNKIFANFLGYSVEESAKLIFKDLVYENDSAAWSNALDTMISAGKAKGELRIIKKDGSFFYSEIRILKNIDKDGKYSGFYCFMEDISERILAQKSLKKAQSFAAATLNSLTANVAIVDFDGTILAINRAWTAFALQNGSDPKNSSVGINYIAICENSIGKYSAESKAFAEGLKKVLHNEVSEFSLVYPCHSPLKKRWFLGKVTKFIGEGSHKVVVLHADITAAKLAEIEVAKSEEKFRTMVQYSSDIITILEGDLKVRFQSPSAGAILGHSLNKNSKGVFEFVHPDDIEKTELAFKKILSSPGEIVAFEVRYRKPDDTYITLECIANNLLLDTNIYGIVINSRDISRRKHAEELTSAALREKELLLKEVHHRVKNNLQIVSSLLKLQEDLIVSPEFKNTFRESINRIKAMSLIHQRLYLENSLSKFDFGNYLRNVVGFLKDTYDVNSRNIKCIIETDKADLDIDSAVPCGLIVNELVSNALKHAFNGSEGEELLIKFESNGRHIITISDNGVGLQAGFTPEEAKTLGFQLIYTLAAQLGAKVEVSGRKGTSFKISFDNSQYAERVKKEKN